MPKRVLNAADVRAMLGFWRQRTDATHQPPWGTRMGESIALTGEQRRLVETNMGLVTWHIRRNVQGIDRPSRDREWDDLFQEGCLGLARAAATYDRDSGVAFTTFAVRRIQSAVNRALHTAFETVRVPESQRGGLARKTVSMDLDALTKPVPARHRPDGAGDDDTIGDRLRSKYDRAVHRARESAKAQPGRRADRDHLIDRLIEERLLVPSVEQRQPLRQIARDMNSSYSRVVQTEKRLVDHVRTALEDDAELPSLQAAARSSHAGVDAPIDAEVVRRMATALDHRFEGDFRRQSRDRRGQTLLFLMERCELNAASVARSLFARLNPAEKARLAASNVPKHER